MFLLLSLLEMSEIVFSKYYVKRNSKDQLDNLRCKSCDDTHSIQYYSFKFNTSLEQNYIEENNLVCTACWKNFKRLGFLKIKNAI